MMTTPTREALISMIESGTVPIPNSTSELISMLRGFASMDEGQSTTEAVKPAARDLLAVVEAIKSYKRAGEWVYFSTALDYIGRRKAFEAIKQIPNWRAEATYLAKRSGGLITSPDGKKYMMEVRKQAN